MSSRIERKEDVVELYQYGRLYLRAFLGSGRVGIETQGVGNPVVDTYDLREFIKVVDLAYAEAAAEQTQTEAKPESLKEESSAAVPVGDGVTVNATDLLAVLDAGLPFGSRAYMPIVEARDRLRAALNGEGTE